MRHLHLPGPVEGVTGVCAPGSEINKKRFFKIQRIISLPLLLQPLSLSLSLSLFPPLSLYLSLSISYTLSLFSLYLYLSYDYSSYNSKRFLTYRINHQFRLPSHRLSLCVAKRSNQPVHSNLCGYTLSL